MERDDIEEGPGVVECDGLESSNRSFFWQVNQPTKKKGGRQCWAHRGSPEQMLSTELEWW